jgi:hypothetical protein
MSNSGWVSILKTVDGIKSGIELGNSQQVAADTANQEGELQTLAQAGISAIHLTANAQGTNALMGSFTRAVTSANAAGNTVTTNTSQIAQNVNFTSNLFASEFTDTITLSTTAHALPQMQGAGMVRGLREAMSLGTVQAGGLAAVVGSFQTAATTQERQALLGSVIGVWANSALYVQLSALERFNYESNTELLNIHVGKVAEKLGKTNKCRWKRVATRTCVRIKGLKVSQTAGHVVKYKSGDTGSTLASLNEKVIANEYKR